MARVRASPYRGPSSDPTRILERARHTRWPEPEGTGRDEEPPEPQTPAADEPPSRAAKG